MAINNIWIFAIIYCLINNVILWQQHDDDEHGCLLNGRISGNIRRMVIAFSAWDTMRGYFPKNTRRWVGAAEAWSGALILRMINEIISVEHPMKRTSSGGNTADQFV